MKTTPERSPEPEEQPSPTVEILKRKKKALASHANSKRSTPDAALTPIPIPPRFTMFLAPETPNTVCDSPAMVPVNTPGDPFSTDTPSQLPHPIIKDGIAGMEEVPKPEDTLLSLNDNWETDPEASVANMLRFIKPAKGNLLATITPAEKGGEWHIFRSGGDHPDLDHHSDNPYDFLPSAKLEALIQHWSNPMVSTGLTEAEKRALGQPKIKKILVKVVCRLALTIEQKTAWF